MSKAEEFFKRLNPQSLVFELSIEPEYTKKQLLMFAEMYHKSEVKKLNVDDVSKQRELLIAYGEQLEGRSLYLEGTTLEKFTDDYISNL